jgi:hypothetical protein
MPLCNFIATRKNSRNCGQPNSDQRNLLLSIPLLHLYGCSVAYSNNSSTVAIPKLHKAFEWYFEIPKSILQLRSLYNMQLSKFESPWKQTSSLSDCGDIAIHTLVFTERFYDTKSCKLFFGTVQQSIHLLSYDPLVSENGRYLIRPILRKFSSYAFVCYRVHFEFFNSCGALVAMNYWIILSDNWRPAPTLSYLRGVMYPVDL